MSYLKHYFLFGKAFLLHVSENSAKTYVLLDFSCNLSSCIWNIYTSFILKCQRIVRITPAYAGKSSNKLESSAFTRDHPRLRREKLLERGIRWVLLGSPPPTRGKVWKDGHMIGDYGITPAYAGKSGLRTGGKRTMTDHPRLRGEKKIPSWNVLPPPGSPPPTRGKGKGKVVYSTVYRITPAYAGKSQK